MKKKNHLSKQDKEDWKNFLKDTSKVPNKDQNQIVDSRDKKFRFDFKSVEFQFFKVLKNVL